jgi:glycosyltransferase involved in cell wall biosynthesis
LSRSVGKAGRDELAPAATVIHVVPSVRVPDGVQDYQEILVGQIANVVESTRSGISLRTATLVEAAKIVHRTPNPILHLQLPMRAWRRFMGISLYPLLIRAIRPNAKIVVTLHEWKDSKVLRRAVNLPILLLTNFVTCPTSDIQAELRGIGRRLRRRTLKNVEVIPVGPNLLWNGNTRDKTPGAPIRVGYFGLLYPGKLPLRMLGVLREIAVRAPSARLVIVGCFLPEQVSLEKQFWRAAEELGLSENIEWHGYVASPLDALALLETCDVFLLLNTRGFTERNGSVLTCLQFGKAVIASAPVPETHSNRVPWVQECISADLLVFVDAASDDSEIANTVLNAAHQRGGSTGAAFRPLWTEIASRHLTMYERLAARN